MIVLTFTGIMLLALSMAAYHVLTGNHIDRLEAKLDKLLKDKDGKD